MRLVIEEVKRVPNQFSGGAIIKVKAIASGVTLEFTRPWGERSQFVIGEHIELDYQLTEAF
jgi:hypothetical protein